MSSPTDSADVLFYVLNSSDIATREHFISKLIRKILDEARQADILFNSIEAAQRFDLSLWSDQAEAFMPHAVNHEVKAPIQLFGDTVEHPQKDVLLNLHTEFQPDFKQYQRTIEILDQTESLIQKGRERFKQYRALGIEPTVHKIGY